MGSGAGAGLFRNTCAREGRWAGSGLGSSGKRTELGLEILGHMGLLLPGPQFAHLYNGKAERRELLLGLWKQGS